MRYRLEYQIVDIHSSARAAGEDAPPTIRFLVLRRAMSDSGEQSKLSVLLALADVPATVEWQVQINAP